MSNENPSLLYLLTEDDNDDLFFERCAERISGKSFCPVEPRRIRKNGGIRAVRQALPIFLNDIKKSIGMDAYFIIALDNDRAPEHFFDNNQKLIHNKIPGLSKRDASKQCRFCEIENRIKERWGANPNNWPAKGAIAVPVQMLESWALIALDPNCAEDLPIFAKKSQQSAKDFYKKSLSDQLKDLCDQYRAEQGGLTKGEFCLKVAEEMDLDEVAQKSYSFALFRDQVVTW